MSQISKFFIRINPLVKFILNSPVHGLLSHSFMLVKFTGKKTGKEYITPMSHHVFGDTVIIVLAETKGRVWWLNYRETAPMSVCIRGQWEQGYASVVGPETPEYKKWFESVFAKAGFIPKIFGVEFDKNNGLTKEQISRLASRSGVVKFTKNRADHL